MSAETDLDTDLFEDCREVSGVLGFGWPTVPAARTPLDEVVADDVVVDLVVDLRETPVDALVGDLD